MHTTRIAAEHTARVISRVRPGRLTVCRVDALDPRERGHVVRWAHVPAPEYVRGLLQTPVAVFANGEQV